MQVQLRLCVALHRHQDWILNCSTVGECPSCVVFLLSVKCFFLFFFSKATVTSHASVCCAVTCCRGDQGSSTTVVEIQEFFRELIWFGAVYYCPVCPKRPSTFKDAEVSRLDLDAREAGIRRHGKNVRILEISWQALCAVDSHCRVIRYF